MNTHVIVGMLLSFGNIGNIHVPARQDQIGVERLTSSKNG
jgi:hypothetical protein